MEQSKDNALVRVATTAAFDGHSVSVVAHPEHGNIVLAGALGRAMGYERPDVLGSLVTREWVDEVAAGDVVLVEGAALAPFKAAGIVGKRARSALFLTETGIHLVALKSDRPAAKKVRRWLIDEVLPSIRRTGSYVASEPGAAAGAPGQVAVGAPRRIEASSGPVGGNPSKAATALRVDVIQAVVAAPAAELLALHELLAGVGHGGGRYHRPGGTPDRELREAMCRDVRRLPLERRDQLARWLSSTLGS